MQYVSAVSASVCLSVCLSVTNLLIKWRITKPAINSHQPSFILGPLLNINVKRSVVKVIRSRNSQTDKNYSTVTDVVTCCLQAGLQLKSVGLVERSAAVWRCSAFIA